MPHHVLVVDDSPSIRRMIAVTLAAEGFEVSACSSGAEATHAAKTKPVDVVVTDLNMPEVDGLELTRQLRLLPNTAKCPILKRGTCTHFPPKSPPVVPMDPPAKPESSWGMKSWK